MSPTEQDLQRQLNDLGRALVAAIASSSDVTDAIRRMHGEGYALNLLLDCQQDGAASARVALTTPVPSRSNDAEPSFRLDGKDVSLLRSLGIDPTRPAPRRRPG